MSTESQYDRFALHKGPRRKVGPRFVSAILKGTTFLSMDDERITYFAFTDTRNKKIPFGIKAKDRTKHVYVIGKTGMGKSTLLENMAIQDIQNGEGLAFVDPHGGTAEKLLDYIPEHRVKDVLYFAPFDMEYPIAFNVMEDIGIDRRHLVVSGLMSAFKKIWEDAWSARMEYILQNTILALLEFPGATLMGINKMLSDKSFRNKVVEAVKDPATRSFWVDEFAKYTERFAAEATPAIQNKVGQFTSNPLIRNIVGQAVSSFDIRKMMDEKKILILNLSKGKVGESNANLLGSMLITKIYLAAMSRADVPAEKLAKLPNFYLYVDEFQSFANESFANILSEARKYKLNLTIAHQYIEQMSEEVRAAVIGNVGTMVVFRVGAIDAELFEKEFAPQFMAEDIVNLGIRQIYLKLMIDGVSSQPFSATTMPPIPAPSLSFQDSVIASSRLVYGRPRAKVEEGIVEQTFSEPFPRPREILRETPRPPTRRFESMPASREGGPKIPTGEAYRNPTGGKEKVSAPRQLDSLRSVLASVVREEEGTAGPSLQKKPETPPPPHPFVSRPPSVSKPTPPSLSPRPAQTPSVKISPSFLPREVRGGKTANKELLQAALAEALKNKPRSATPPASPPVAPAPADSVSAPEPKEESKKKDTTPHGDSTPAPSPPPRPPKEVPEAELKRLLET